MFSMFKRIGAKSCKVQLNIDLKELKIFNERDDITLVCIELKRGSKSISSSSKVWSERESLTVKFDDQLALFMTLYKDSNGKYIEKRGNLVLNGHSKVTNSTIVLGSVDLKLNLLASDYVAQKLDSVFVDSTGATVASLSAIATSRFIGDGIADDDESSNMSEVSSKSYLQTTDVRYGSVYRDISGKIDPDVSSETTEKFRNKILQRNLCATPDQDDGGTLSDGYEISETSSKRKNKGIISKQVGFSPRVKHSLSCGPKGEEIADLYRELEQANRRAATAQQEQRNISAVIAADTRKHEASVNELRMKINLMQSEIEGLTPAVNTAQRGESDCICSDVQSLDTVNTPADVGKGELSDEDPEELRSLVESLRRKLKNSMSNEMTTASELTRMQAVLIASNKKREAESAEMAVRMAAVEDISVAAVEVEVEAEAAAVSRTSSGLTILMGTESTEPINQNCHYKNKNANIASLHAEIGALTDDLTEAHRSQEVLVAVVSSRDAELAELKEDHSKVAAELTEILLQNEKLTSVCAELRRTISEREKKSDGRTPNSTGAAGAESELIADLQIQLAIKRVSENSLLLREMQELQEEVNDLQQEKSLNNDLAASLKIAGEKYAELAAAKIKLESSLEASNRTVVSLAGDIEVLRALVTDLYRNVSPDESVEFTNLRRRMTDAKINFKNETDNEDQERRFQSNLESWYGDLRVTSRPTSVDLGPDDSIAELDIEKLILESEEELVRVKEKRVGFKQYKLHRRECTDKVVEKSASAGRKREIAALLAQNCELEDKLFKSESARLLLTSEATASKRAGGAEKETDRLAGYSSHDSPLPTSLLERDALYIRGDFVASPADPDPDPDPADSTCSSVDHNHDQYHDQYHDHDQYEDHDGDQESLLVERIFSLENSAEVEKRKFEGRIQILLRASGMYDSTYSNFIAGTDQSDERWKEVVRAQSDIERKKVMTLKTCLMRFSSKLTADEVDELEDYGVVLAPRLNSRSRNKGLNLGSALCFI